MLSFLARFCPAAVSEGRAARMGIVNATPDSFSDGGLYADPEAAAAQAERLLRAGADLIDLGAESTRPGFAPVSEEEESRRLIPALRAIRRRCPEAVVSVDTRKASVARAALEAGAALVNDVSALGDPGMAELVRSSGCGIVLMNGWPEHVGARSRAAGPGALGAWVEQGLADALARADRAGIARDCLCLDPGFGFGLRHADNAEVLDALPGLVAKFSPIPFLVGASRKHFLRDLYTEVTDPDEASRRFHDRCVAAGAKIVRAHKFGI